MAKLTRIMHVSQWKPEHREKAISWAILSGFISILMTVLMLLFVALVLHNIPKPVEVYGAITRTTEVQNWARKSLLLWMAGGASSEKRLMKRSSAAQSIKLSDLPFDVRDIDPAEIKHWDGEDAVEWQITFDVTYVAPGSSSLQISDYMLTVLENGAGDYQLVTWPSIVNESVEPFKVKSKYTFPIDVGSDFGQSMKRFATAYLTSSSTDGGSSMGQFVSAKFSGSPIANSPYTSAEVQEIRAVDGTGNLRTAKPGDSVQVLVTVKAAASLQTWSIMQFALEVSLGANHVWLVDGVTAPIDWGALTN